MLLWSPPRRPVGSARPHTRHGPSRRVVAGRPPVAPSLQVRSPARRPVDPPPPPPDEAGRPAPAAATSTPRAALTAVASLGTPALLVTVVAQAPPGPVRGLALALGWVGLASWFERPRRRHRA